MPLDVLDFTELKKRGLLKENVVVKEDSPEYFDFSNGSESSGGAEQTPSALSFLDTFAASASQGENVSGERMSSANSTGVSELNVKLENLEYQLERLAEKITLIESKVSIFEEKVGGR